MEYMRIIGVAIFAIAAIVEFVAAFTKPTILYTKNSPYKNDPPRRARWTSCSASSRWPSPSAPTSARSSAKEKGRKQS